VDAVVHLGAAGRVDRRRPVERVHRRAEETSPQPGRYRVVTLLAHADPDGRFSEQMREIALDIWHA
jgi:hypothetical protein